MKTFSLIHNDGLPYLRQVNPLAENKYLVSPEAYEAHELAFINEAILLLNPLPNKNQYLASELYMLWQFSNDKGETWETVTEPNFIETKSDQYRQVFKVKSVKVVPYQLRVNDWVKNTFSESVANDVQERCFRFIEEALELVQSLGMSKEDVIRQIVHTYGRPPGEVKQEIGGVFVTLNALSSAASVDALDAAETELTNNVVNWEAIREKWLARVSVSPQKI